MNIKREIANFACVSENQILVSPKAEMGDFCLPCFMQAKLEKLKPNIYAKKLLESLSQKHFYLVEKMEVLNGYLNFFINKKIAGEKILQNALNSKFKYKNHGFGKTVCIDYCSANLAKYLHIGHISTTVIGESLNRIYRAIGYNVVRINYLGDYGTTFGKMVVAIQLWGKLEDVKTRGVEAIQDLYIKFSANENEELMEKARFASRQIEEKTGKEFEIYKTIIDIAIKECKRIIKMLDIDFDDWRGESFYADRTNDIVLELEKMGISKTENNAQIVDLSEYNLPLVVVKRSDGGSVYITRDLCAVQDRFNLYNFDEMLYVVAMQHNTYFAQLFKILELLKRPYVKKLKHISYGMFSMPDGKIASRKGKQALFTDIFKRAYNQAKSIIKERDFDEKIKKEISAKIAKSVIGFSILKVERAKDKVFDIKTAVSFEGETAPYLQYTYARCRSLIENFEEIFDIDFNEYIQSLNGEKGENSENFANSESNESSKNFKNNEVNENFENLKLKKVNKKMQEPIKVTDEVFNNHFKIFKIVSEFDDIVLQAGQNAEPCLIARELIDLCKEFNRLYQDVKILNENNLSQSFFLIQIVYIVQKTLQFGMPLVFVDVLQKM